MTKYYNELTALLPPLAVSWVLVEEERFYKGPIDPKPGTTCTVSRHWIFTITNDTKTFCSKYFGSETDVADNFSRWRPQDSKEQREQERFVSLIWSLVQDASLIDSGEVKDGLDLIDQGLCDTASSARTTYAALRDIADGMDRIGIRQAARQKIQELLADY